jgi:hypothetical protein
VLICPETAEEKTGGHYKQGVRPKPESIDDKQKQPSNSDYSHAPHRKKKQEDIRTGTTHAGWGSTLVDTIFRNE